MTNNYIKYRDKILIWGVEKSKNSYRKHFKRKKTAWQISSDKLVNYPTDSLGSSLGTFLKTQGFELMDKMEDHDVMHVLMNFDTTVQGESEMQFFLWGNGRRSLYVFVSILIALVFIPEGWKDFYRQYQKGRSYLPIYKWDFLYLLKEPLTELRQLAQGQTFSYQNTQV